MCCWREHYTFYNILILVHCVSSTRWGKKIKTSRLTNSFMILFLYFSLASLLSTTLPFTLHSSPTERQFCEGTTMLPDGSMFLDLVPRCLPVWPPSPSLIYLTNSSLPFRIQTEVLSSGNLPALFCQGGGAGLSWVVSLVIFGYCLAENFSCIAVGDWSVTLVDWWPLMEEKDLVYGRCSINICWVNVPVYVGNIKLMCSVLRSHLIMLTWVTRLPVSISFLLFLSVSFLFLHLFFFPPSLSPFLLF